MSARPVIAVVDYGMGNRRSVEKALEHVGARAKITRDRDALATADGLVVPGVGAFPRAMSNLHELGLSEAIIERASAGAPVLGICLGMHVLFERSFEFEPTAGLGLIAGEVTGLDTKGLRLPHIGWNRVDFVRSSPLTGSLPAAGAHFYHVHSLVPRPAEADDVLATSEYGESFVTAVQRGTVFGVQFHPEKSSTHGLALLRNFASVCARHAQGVAA
ncbi:MAG TPA: imidazole glycerol phosphate synthase subunit HisH [Solirubrobacteraceae bacterium]|jgi:glutamine amidotransferase|nr:imidazole glycerol phosphate synthase subunit HisH [Solirubrobacteraceae bacterium]